MTNKQIIDGIDVSGCEFFDECEVKPDWSDCLAHCSPYPEGACYGDCSEYPNCYYKQLKRKEQECEELKEQLERADEDIKMKCTRCAMTNKLDEQLDQLKAENEKLDTENKRLVAELANPVFDSFEELDQLKSTLQEIKEIAEENDELLQGYHKEWANNKLILQIISECEVGNE